MSRGNAAKQPILRRIGIPLLEESMVIGGGRRELHFESSRNMGIFRREISRNILRNMNILISILLKIIDAKQNKKAFFEKR